MTIQICVPTKVRDDEQRIALAPDIVNLLTKERINVNIETGKAANELIQALKELS